MNTECIGGTNMPDLEGSLDVGWVMALPDIDFKYHETHIHSQGFFSSFFLSSLKEMPSNTPPNPHIIQKAIHRKNKK